MTTKFFQCLITGTPIVTAQFFDELVAAIKQGKPLPETDKFIPNIVDLYVSQNVLHFDAGRGNMFEKEKFVFYEKDRLKFSPIFELVGGTAISSMQLPSMALAIFIVAALRGKRAFCVIWMTPVHQIRAKWMLFAIQAQWTVRTHALAVRATKASTAQKISMNVYKVPLAKIMEFVSTHLVGLCAIAHKVSAERAAKPM